MFRKDRTRNGGGAAIYAKSSLSPSLVNLSPSPIEFILVTVTCHNLKYHIGCFYRPPFSLSDTTHCLTTLSSLDHSISQNLFLFGNFNTNVSSSISTPLSSISDYFNKSLQQIIFEPTHFSHAGTPSTIDLAFIPSSLLHYTYSILPPVLSSDHNSILVSIHLPPSPNTYSSPLNINPPLITTYSQHF